MVCFTDDISPLAFLMSRRVAEVVVEQVPRRSFMDGLTRLKPTFSVVDFVPGIPDCYSDRTTMEKAFICATVAYGGWFAYDKGLFSYVSRIGKAIIPGLKQLGRIFGPLETVLDPEMQRSSVVLESRRIGSDEVVRSIPRCQAKVGVIRDGKFVVLGCAVRFENNVLVAPDHVIGGEELENKFVSGTQSMVSLKDKERIPLSTDLSMIILTDSEFSKIGISVCKIQPVSDVGAYASVVGPLARGTTGTLKNDPRCFGRVVYEGTTIAGYSGAAYTSGNVVLGIHQMGGMINGGFSASYVWTLIRQEKGLRFESSEDWLLGQYRAGKKLRWSAAGDPDYVQVVINGAYTNIETRSMLKAFGSDWQNNEVIEMVSRKSYDDSVMESAEVSGEAGSSILPGVLNAQSSDQALVELNLQNVINAYSRLSRKQKKSFQKHNNLLNAQNNGTAGQASVLPATN